MISKPEVTREWFTGSENVCGSVFENVAMTLLKGSTGAGVVESIFSCSLNPNLRSGSVDFSRVAWTVTGN